MPEMTEPTQPTAGGTSTTISEALQRRGGTPEEIKRYAEWHKAAHGWDPFEPVKCSKCNRDVLLINIYRCYDCDGVFCKQCVKEHCQESRRKSQIRFTETNPQNEDFIRIWVDKSDWNKARYVDGRAIKICL